MQEIASASGIEVSIAPILEDSEGRMSSSRIRSALKEGDLETAEKLMGRAYRFQGNVVTGRGLGRRLGWPTANLQVDGRKFLPKQGVYAALVWTSDKTLPFSSVMNLGPQPTVDPTAPSAVEVHLLDKEINLLGEELIIEPVHRIRFQKKRINIYYSIFISC